MALTRRGGLRRCAVAGAVLLLAGLAVSPAHPHAIVTKTTLQDRPILADVATPVILYFNSRIEPGFTKVLLVEESKRERALDVTPGQRGDTLTVLVPPLAPGAYALRYKVLAVDGHVTEGILRFRVRPAK